MQWELVRGWLTKAENDLLAGRRILEGGMPESYDTVSFHAQQAAEKALKALLVRHQVAFRKGHNLAELLELVDSVELGTREALGAIGELTPYAVEGRYPAGLPSVDRDEAARHVALADAAVVYVRSRLAPYLDAGRPGE